MRPNSLAFRLTFGAAIFTGIAIIIAGLVLTGLYRQTVERTFDEQLTVSLNTLVGQLALLGQASPQPDDGAGLTEPQLGEARFGELFSGWYWQISRGNRVLLASRSLGIETLVLDVPPEEGEDAMRVTMTGPAGEALRGLAQAIVFSTGEAYQVIVTGNETELLQQVGRFRTSVIITLVIFGIGLIVATLIQIRWALRPLDRVRRGLADLRSGKHSRFEGQFPAEIEPLARELNALLDSNQQIIERARTQVGNLAHGLKTPLSVITNEARAARGPLAEKVTEQAAMMSKQISHYLDRARIAARSEVIGSLTPVEPVVSRLARAMTRIHEDRGIQLAVNVPAGATFRGEQQDLEEIVGNLADNACKWAGLRVAIDVAYQRPAGEGTDGTLTINIDDDGPGLTPEQRTEATRRGRRLDESKPGSGLGLSIVADLVGLYGGKFRLDRAPTGGLRAEVILPAA